MYHLKVHSSVNKEWPLSFTFSLLRGRARKTGSGEADVRFEGAAELQCNDIWVRGSETVHGAKRQRESKFGSTNRGDVLFFMLYLKDWWFYLVQLFNESLIERCILLISSYR